jgi:hypothetical protein
MKAHNRKRLPLGQPVFRGRLFRPVAAHERRFTAQHRSTSLNLLKIPADEVVDIAKAGRAIPRAGASF